MDRSEIRKTLQIAVDRFKVIYSMKPAHAKWDVKDLGGVIDAIASMSHGLKYALQYREAIRELLRAGGLNAEGFFNAVCHQNRDLPFSTIQFICCEIYGIPKYQFRNYKQRRKNKRKDYRDEPIPRKDDVKRIFDYLRDVEEYPALEDLAHILEIPDERFKPAVDNLIKGRKLTTKKRRFPGGKVRTVLVYRPTRG
jgi:hypothetical protein